MAILRRIILLVLLSAAVGCAPKAAFLTVRPATIDIGGMQRLVVAEFRGEPLAASSIRSQLISHLSENGHYTLIDEAELPQSMPGETPFDLVDAARRAGIDAVLLGTVTQYHAGQPPSSTEDDVPFVGSLLSSSQGASRHWGRSTVAIDFQLVDVASSQIRDSRQISRSYQHRNQHRAAPSGDEQLQELSRQCVTEIVNALAPHRTTTEVTLARQYYGRGLAQLRRGNDLAQAGNWNDAETAWMASLEQSRTNHAAHYNLALAAEARGDYAGAVRHLDQAVALFGDRLYQQHRQQLSANQANQTAAIAQTQAKNMMAIARRGHPNTVPIGYLSPESNANAAPDYDGSRSTTMPSPDGNGLHPLRGTREVPGQPWEGGNRPAGYNQTGNDPTGPGPIDPLAAPYPPP